MAVESDDDRLLFLQDWEATAVFGSGTNAITVQGIFDNKYAGIDELGVIIESAEPQFECRTSDVASVSNGEVCVINGGTSYTVTTLEADGTGMTLVTLHKT